MFNKTGIDITKVFIDETIKAYQLNDWKTILTFYYKNVGSFEYRAPSSSRLNLAKTKIETVTKRLTGDIPHFNTVVDFNVTLKDTIYYDRNTYVVKNVSGVTLVDYDFDEVYTDYIESIFYNSMSSDSYIQNSYTGVFKIGTTLKAMWYDSIVEEFPYTYFSMSISPN